MLGLELQKENLLSSWIKQQFLIQKLNTPFGYIIGALLALGVAAMVSLLPLKIAALIIGGLIAIPMVIYCFLNINFAIIVTLCVGFFVTFLNKYTSAPIGTALDGLLYLMIFNMIVGLSKTRDFSFARNPISVFIIIWIYYNILQAINPWAESQMAWVYTVRSVAILLSIFFIGCYAFTSLDKIKTIFKVIIGLSFLSALYSLKQEWLGFSSAEMAWLHADKERFTRIFQWSRLRVFSFFSDPTTFGILMAYMSVFCIILATGPLSWLKRGFLVFAAACMILGMAYAGSRTPFVLLPVGIIFYALLTFKKQTVIWLGGFLIVGSLFMLRSSSNAVIWRIQSSFRVSEDASVKVRLKNQARIQPFIQEHPIGKGLGSTGVWAKRFTPHSWLASFAHDSLFVRLAVEAGWIGLIFYCSMLFIIMRTGLYYYFRVRDPMIKTLYLALVVMIFILSLASYPQEAITLLPTSIIFYLSLAALVKLKDFDTIEEATETT